VRAATAPAAPPHCPNPGCRFHRRDRGLWRYVKDGFFTRRAAPHRIQRYRCVTCRRHFSSQTFHPTYWLKRPDLLEPVFHHLVACAGYRQVARMYRVSPQTVLGQAARLGRHCLLFHLRHRPAGPPPEPLALDSFESFEFSQDHPTSFHVLAGQRSHFFHGFTDSELRRKGRMTRAQKRRRARLEAALGRPDPRSIETEVAALLALVVPPRQAIVLHTDEHRAYPRALRRLPHLTVDHRTLSSRAARTPQNPLFPINLLDLLIRHSSANHKRETIAFSKRRQAAIERLWIFLVWRNYGKSFSERRPGQSPAMRLGLFERILGVGEILARRLFPGRIELPERWARHYRRLTPTRRIARPHVHRLKYAF
jgi:transposase-like protein